MNFFLCLIQLYQNNILKNEDNSSHDVSEKNKIKSEHLIFVLEDCNLFDHYSIEFLRLLKDVDKINNITIIYTLQEKLFSNHEEKENKFIKFPEFFREGEIESFPMNNIIDTITVSKIIKFAILKLHIKTEKIGISRIEENLIDIIISKSFKGIPLFIFDMTENLINSKKLIQHLSTEILVTSELLEMVVEKNWCEFKIPIRIERIIGGIIDSLQIKEIILLKIASVIGNIFDIARIIELNPFVNLSLEEIYFILQKLEKKGILEFLYDFNKKNLICKFCIPFLREILYQRMLIEQKNQLHLMAARTLQNPKFKYISHEKEVKLLGKHLKNSERTLLVQMEEDDSVEETYNKLYKNNLEGGNNLNKWAIRSDEVEGLNITNLKIFLVKDIVQKIRKIQNLGSEAINDEESHGVNSSNKFLQQIRYGIIDKKSDKNITWEG